jgi:hypothetical protein
MGKKRERGWRERQVADTTGGLIQVASQPLRGHAHRRTRTRTHTHNRCRAGPSN